jgi:hypothetical protein
MNNPSKAGGGWGELFSPDFMLAEIWQVNNLCRLFLLQYWRREK